MQIAYTKYTATNNSFEIKTKKIIFRKKYKIPLDYTSCMMMHNIQQTENIIYCEQHIHSFSSVQTQSI